MRRCDLLLVLCTLAAGACAEQAPPRIGVTVGTAPGQAASIASAELGPEDPGYFEAIVVPPSAPNADAEQAIEQAYAFVRDPRVVAVIGHDNSAASLAASQIYNSAGLVQIAPTTTAPVYGEAGPFSFRLVPSDTLQAEYLSRVRRHHFPDSRVAVVHVNDDYGRGLLRVLRPQLDSIVFESLYADPGDSADIALLSAGIIESRADVLMWLGRPGALGRLLGPLREALPDLTVVCADACDVPVVYSNADGRFTGIHFVRFTDPGAGDSAMSEFQRRYLEKTGVMASSQALLTYDAVSLVRAALRAGARSRGEVREYLQSLGSGRAGFDGLTGRIEFDASGSFLRPYMLAKVKADGVVPAEHVGGHHER